MKKDTLTPSLSKAVNYLNNWDHKADVNSIATTIAIEWATKWSLEIPAATTEEEGTQIIKKYERMVKEVSTQKKKELLKNTLEQLEKMYGTWEMPWGEINRYQRTNPGNMMDDQAPSWAVSQASSKWGSLPSFDSKRYDGTIKRYGYNGNSFVAAVSFGKTIIAKTIITGGQSRFSNSNHFTDQAQGFIDGQFKTIHFYKADVLAHKVTSYKPGFIK
jgi:acyl-homoserine lactone acylase PvdQ